MNFVNIYYTEKKVRIKVKLISNGIVKPSIRPRRQSPCLTGLSLDTVKSHLWQAYQKLDVDNKMDAVIKAREMGVI
jgi:hypothetical protein